MRSTLVSLLAAALVAAPAAAQAPTAAAPAPVRPAAATRPDGGTTSADSALARMRTRLRDLVVAQERHWSDHGTYTTDVSALGFFEKGRRTPPDSASVQVISAGGRGWSGIATHRALRGKSCVVFVGNADELPKVPVTLAGRRPAETEGKVECDAP